MSFSEAQELFRSGVDYLEIFDEEHSETEDRYFAIGPIVRGIITMVYCEKLDSKIRKITARFATKKENVLYAQYIRGRL